MTASDLAKAGAGALIGALLGWTSNSLRLDGELRALTQSVQRIEQRLDLMAERAAKAPHP